MKFKGKGKGPLELPRLSSIGPMSEAADQIGKLVFRGSNIEDLNNDEFTNNAIDGRPVDVWTLDTAAVARRYDLKPSEVDKPTPSFHTYREATPFKQIIDEFRIGPVAVNDHNVEAGKKQVAIEDLMNNGLIANHISDEVTGGISKNLGAGFRFSGTASAEFNEVVPLVMFLEKNRIPARLVEVKYNSEFINEHPGLAGAADTGGRMLVVPKLKSNYELGNFISWHKVVPWRGNITRDWIPYGAEEIRVDEDDLIVKWAVDPLNNFISLEPEQEIFAYADKIELDRALFGVCMYVGPKKLDRLHRMIAHKSINTDNWREVRQAIQTVHDEVQNRMKSYSDRLVTCYISQNFKTKRTRVPTIIFQMLYDGNEFTEDYDEAVPFTDPSKF